MKGLPLFFFLLSAQFALGQSAITPTDKIKINGFVKSEEEITYSEIEHVRALSLGDFKITNHLGEYRKKYNNVKGVPLLPFLEKVEIDEPNPKMLSKYYFVFKASDGYAVVASWNELFNTEIGKSFYFVIEADGKNLRKDKDRILLISTKDIATGRRHVKALEQIVVKRFE